MEAKEAETIRRGELTPAELIPLAPAAARDEEGREALYDGLRVTVADLIRSAAPSPELGEWRETLTHLIGLVEHADEIEPDPALPVLATRLGTLRDLSADAMSYQAAYSVERLREVPAYRDLLCQMQMAGGTANRKTVLAAAGLKQANGTRVLKLLENARLLQRQRAGGEVTVTLTSEGHRVLAAWDVAAAGAAGRNVVALNEVRLKISGGPIDGMPDVEQGYPAARPRTYR